MCYLYKYRILLDAYLWEKNTSSLVQFSEEDFFLKNSFLIENSIKIFKENSFNRIVIEKLDEQNPKYNNENYKYLGNIIKEKEKYFFEPLLIDLGNDKESINEVPWLIYNTKTEPEINHSYIIKEGDILKMGNAIFKIKMIQINENGNEPKGENTETENNNNNTLIISGSANNSLELNNYKINDINIASTKIKVKRNSNAQSEKNAKLNEEALPISKPNNPENFVKIEKSKDKIRQKNKNKICRICYQEEDDVLLNPLIRPCKCSGSMKYIHLKCLLHWLKSRTANSPIMNSNNENFNVYYINQKTECELCKQLFPDYIKHNDIKYCLIDFDYAQESKIKENNNNQNYINTNMDINANNNNNSKINNENHNNFIVIDTVFPLTDTNRYRYIVKFNNNNEMKIGRGLDNQLILNEITVSRNHCILKLEKNKYGKYDIKMEDQSSKFGSLILLQSNKIEIIKGKPLHMQISNVHFVIQYKKYNSLLSCCDVEVVDEKNSYEKINNRAVRNKNVVNILTEVASDDGGENDNSNNKEKKDNISVMKKEIKKDNNIKNDEDIKVLLLNNNANSSVNLHNQKDNENIKTNPKEEGEKKDENENKDNNEDISKDNDNLNENKDNDKVNNKEEKKEVDKKSENNKEEINDSIEVEEEK